jgi:hypothetical protein
LRSVIYNKNFIILNNKIWKNNNEKNI